MYRECTGILLLYFVLCLCLLTGVSHPSLYVFLYLCCTLIRQTLHFFYKHTIPFKSNTTSINGFFLCGSDLKGYTKISNLIKDNNENKGRNKKQEKSIREKGTARIEMQEKGTVNLLI